MAQTGYTPISLYYSSTASNTPTAGNLVAGELAINTADGKLFYKDSAGVVQVIAGKGGSGVAGGSNTQVQYNSSGSLAGSANMTFNGTTLTLANDASISGLTVGKGGGSVSTNTAVGASALAANTTGSSNTAIGQSALQNNTTGLYSTAVGYQASYANLTAGDLTAVGYQALRNATAGSNLGVGYQAGANITTGINNTAVGDYGTLVTNTTGSSNTAIGTNALQANTTASYNTAVGYQAGYSNTTGIRQVHIGYQAGYLATGGYNVLVGGLTGSAITTGTANTFIGDASGVSITTGSKNTILGAYTGNNGGLDIRTASNYIVLSDGDGNPRGIFDGSGNFYSGTTSQITTNAGANFVGTTYSGGTSVFATYNATTSTSKWTFGPNSGGTFLVYTAAGAGVNLPYGNTSWGSSSDIRLKNVTGGFTNALSDIAQLEPIRFTWKNDNSNKPCVGLSAQSVQKVLPEVIDEEATVDGDETKYLSVRYTEIIPLLVASIKELKAEVDSLKQQLGK